MVFLVWVSSLTLKAQPLHQSVSITWTDSLNIGSRPYYISDIQKDTSYTIANLYLGEKQYLYYHSKDTFFRHTFHSAQKSKQLWTNYYQSKYKSLNLSPAMLGRSNLMLIDSSGNESKVLTFRNSSDYPAQIVLEQIHSNLYIFVLPGARLNDTIGLYCLQIALDGEPKCDTIYPPWTGLRPKLIHLQFHHNHLECLFTLHRITPSEKRGFRRNYHFTSVRIPFNSEPAVFHVPPIAESLFYPTIRPLKGHEYFGTYGTKSGKISEGIFLIDSSWIRHVPYPDWLLQKFNAFKLFNRNKIRALYPDSRIVQGNDTVFLFEQYFLNASGGTASKPIFDFHYNHLVMVKVRGDSIQFSFIPKKQVTFDDFGQISSYNLIRTDRSAFVLFNSGSKYLFKSQKTYRNRRINQVYMMNLEELGKVVTIENRKIPILTHLNRPLGNGKYQIYGRKGSFLYIGELTISPL